MATSDNNGRDDPRDSPIIRAAVQVVATIGEMVRLAGKDGIPASHVYLYVQHVMSVATFNAVITTLMHEELLTRSNHVLRWIGPDPQTQHRYIVSIFPGDRCALCDRGRYDTIHTAER